MSLDLAYKIIDEIKDHAEFIWLQDMGEPFLHPQLFEIVEHAAHSGLRVGVSTNVNYLSEAVLDGLKSGRLDYLTLAIDGASQETYSMVRTGGNYSVAVANALKILELKKRLGLETLITLQCIMMPETSNDIKIFKNQWNLRGVDFLRIRQLGHTGQSHGSIYINKRKGLCYWPWCHPIVKWNGDLSPCCHDFDAECIVGNLKEKSFRELWNCEAMQDFRSKIIAGNYQDIGICRNCNMLQPSLPLIAASAFCNQFTLYKLIPVVETLICKLRY